MDRKKIKTLVMILIGTWIEALGYYHLNYQNSLSDGGFVGISLLAKYKYNISPSITLLLLDLPIFIYGFKVMGRKFVVYSLIAALSFSGFYELCEQFSPFIIDLTNTMWLAAMLAGILNGFGLGIVLKYGAATGGEEIIALQLNKHFGMSVGTFFIITDLIVLGISSTYLPLVQILYTALAVIVAGRVVHFTFNFKRKSQPKVTFNPSVN